MMQETTWEQAKVETFGLRGTNLECILTCKRTLFPHLPSPRSVICVGICLQVSVRVCE